MGGGGGGGATKTLSVGGVWICSGAAKSKFLQVSSTFIYRLVITYRIHTWLVFLFLLASLKINSKKSHFCSPFTPKQKKLTQLWVLNLVA